MSSQTIDSDALNGAIGNYDVGSIDGKTQGNTTVFTTANNGLLFYPTSVDFILTTLASLGTPPIVNVGWTASNYTDLVNGQALAANLTTQGAMFRVPLTTANITPVPANTAVVLRVGTAAIGTTTYTMRCIIRGYYR